MNVVVEIIKRIEAAVPELNNKIQVGAVEPETKTPYATCTVEESPIRTIHGIAGYRTEAQVSVFHHRKAESDRIKARVVETLDGWSCEGHRFYYTTGSEDFSFEYNIHAHLLTFKIS